MSRIGTLLTSLKTAIEAITPSTEAAIKFKQVAKESTKTRHFHIDDFSVANTDQISSNGIGAPLIATVPIVVFYTERNSEPEFSSIMLEDTSSLINAVCNSATWQATGIHSLNLTDARTQRIQSDNKNGRELVITLQITWQEA